MAGPVTLAGPRPLIYLEWIAQIATGWAQASNMPSGGFAMRAARLYLARLVAASMLLSVSVWPLPLVNATGASDEAARPLLGGVPALAIEAVVLPAPEDGVVSRVGGEAASQLYFWLGRPLAQ